MRPIVASLLLVLVTQAACTRRPNPMSVPPAQTPMIGPPGTRAPSDRTPVIGQTGSCSEPHGDAKRTLALSADSALGRTARGELIVQVTAKPGGKPVVGAAVRFDSARVMANTDSTGTARIREAAGVQRLLIRAIGRGWWADTVRIRAGYVDTLRLPMGYQAICSLD